MIKKFLRKIFKIHSTSKEWVNIRTEYLEHDTKCDLCDRKSKCEPYLIDATSLNDTRTHVTNCIGYTCPLYIKELFNGEYKEVYFHKYCESIKTHSELTVDDRTFKTCLNLISIHAKQEGIKGLILIMPENDADDISICPILTADGLGCAFNGLDSSDEEIKARG